MTVKIFYVMLLLSHAVLIVLAIVQVFLESSFANVAALATVSFMGALPWMCYYWNNNIFVLNKNGDTRSKVSVKTPHCCKSKKWFVK